ncbi:MAG: hypothetical protein NWE91_08090 [Candidatus Bathyarchaeota archaeon]|nr:hypothetical protein [Candidatus Bathyarchaeota archaeon]
MMKSQGGLALREKKWKGYSKKLGSNLMIQYSKTFLEYSSSADNGTWNKTGFFRNVRIDTPAFNEQKQVLEAYNELENLENKLARINSKINQIFTRQIASIVS